MDDSESASEIHFSTNNELQHSLENQTKIQVAVSLQIEDTEMTTDLGSSFLFPSSPPKLYCYDFFNVFPCAGTMEKQPARRNDLLGNSHQDSKPNQYVPENEKFHTELSSRYKDQDYVVLKYDRPFESVIRFYPKLNIKRYIYITAKGHLASRNLCSKDNCERQVRNSELKYCDKHEELISKYILYLFGI